ncbi:DUF4270 family protein [Neptunitalea lumnitzerae]|uniref:DUF4270 family protein n=1 Tax=Neptunitalea lumnitzerae TaxID=2965509 RepID=A0ABQ5MI99_9FLAO|nr:DUF4270 family protein [Neptunitalea sp. Y10]GLB49031.1 hypothetical protein Y10_13990 [Neptunitalea sp. Y10]
MKKLLWSCLITISIIACSTADDITLEAGESFTNTSTVIHKIDTMSVDFSTFKFDSIPFPTLGRILLGSYTDPIFGKSESSSYLEMVPQHYDIDDEGVFDSIVLIMGYDNYFYNDTLSQMTYNVYEITEDVKPADNESNFYNTSTLDYDTSILLGSHTFTPKPMEGDSIRITLNYPLGENIFNKIRDKDITDVDLFRDNFNGITIQPEYNDNGNFIGFTTGSDYTMLRLYYSVPEDISTEPQTYDLVIDNSAEPQTYFNHIETDYTGTVFENFQDEENTYSSTTTGNSFYLQTGTGIASKIAIPNIKSLYDLGNSGTVMDAYLKIYVSGANYSDNRYLSDSLSVYVLDRHQAISDALYDYAGNEIIAKLTSKTEFGETYYTIPLISYVDNLLNSDSIEDLSLCLLPEDYETTMNRIIFNDGNTEDFNAELVITYALYYDE